LFDEKNDWELGGGPTSALFIMRLGVCVVSLKLHVPFVSRTTHLQTNSITISQ